MKNKFEIEFLKSIPYDRESGDLKSRSMLDFSYPTKVSLFDYRCSGCGFAVYRVGNMVFNNWIEAVDLAQSTGEGIERECSRIQTETADGEVMNLSLTEVIINGCEFWTLDFRQESEENNINIGDLLNEVLFD